MPPRAPVPKCLSAALLLAAAGACGAAPAGESAVTLYGAYRSGGSFTDSTTQSTLKLAGSAAAAVALDVPLDANRQVQWYLSHQRTDIDLAPLSPASSTQDKLPLQVTYLHVGGSVFFEGPVGKGPYLVGGLGATLFTPDLAGLSNEIRASMNLGLGYQWPLAQRIALRLEARGYVTLINSSGGFLCSGGCVVSIQGDTLTQGEVQIGLSFGF